MNDRPVSLLVVEDDAIVRSWVRLALEGSEFAIVAEASGADEAYELARRRRPDLALVDYRLPGTLGTELVRRLRREGRDTPVVIMTANAEQGLNELARESGAQGSALKSPNPEELLETLRAVRRGLPAFDTRHPRRPAGRAPLSPREREVLRMVAAGATNREIAAALNLGDETVKTLLGRAFAKLGVRRRAEAVSIAHERGLL
jgi:DNA-binding NarL/FixJ family response regulator